MLKFKGGDFLFAGTCFHLRRRLVLDLLKPACFTHWLAGKMCYSMSVENKNLVECQAVLFVIYGLEK